MDFWEKSFDEMELMHKANIYPPKASVIAYTNSSALHKAAVTVEVKGTRNDEAARVTIVKEYSAGKLCCITFRSYGSFHARATSCVKGAAC